MIFSSDLEYMKIFLALPDALFWIGISACVCAQIRVLAQDHLLVSSCTMVRKLFGLWAWFSFPSSLIDNGFSLLQHSSRLGHNSTAECFSTFTLCRMDMDGTIILIFRLEICHLTLLQNCQT
jgi:hypothetical protein